MKTKRKSRPSKKFRSLVHTITDPRFPDVNPIAYAKQNPFWLDDDGYIAVGAGDELRTVAQIQNRQQALRMVKQADAYPDFMEALGTIRQIAEEGVAHRYETGKPVWIALDEIKNIIAALAPHWL